MSINRLVAAIWLLPLTVLALLYGPTLAELVGDRARVTAWIESMGAWGPLALIALNIAQIVFAPIPGYFVQAAAGYLFGVLAGGLYGTIGMLLGGALAMLLARWYGRPLAARLAGADRLQRWEGVIHSDSTWPWFILLLGPVGDVPYFIAGLTHAPVWRVILIALLVRSPSVFAAAAVGAGIIELPAIGWLAVGALFLLFVLLFNRQLGASRDRCEQWLQRTVLRSKM